MLQNIGLSLAIVTVLLPVALLGILGLGAVVAVHEIAEVFVIANGIRAGRTHPYDDDMSASRSARSAHDTQRDARREAIIPERSGRTGSSTSQ